MKQIEFGANPNNKPQAVHAGLYIRDMIVPGYENQGPVNVVIMINRWDGTIGFPGGMVDPGESLQQALERELSEEINFTYGNLIPIVSFETDKIVLHFYGKEMGTGQTPPNQKHHVIENLINETTYAKHFISETTGMFFVFCKNFGKNGIARFLKGNNLQVAVREQFIALAKNQGFYQPDWE